MTRYDHAQPAWLLLLICGIPALLLGAASFFARADLSIAFRAISIPLLLILLLFYQLRVRIQSETLHLSFGLGLIWKKIALEEVREVREVRNAWIHGWGIRMLENGWLYNVSGLDAIELDLASGGVLRIGTDEPAILARALRQALGNPKRSGHG